MLCRMEIDFCRHLDISFLYSNMCVCDTQLLLPPYMFMYWSTRKVKVPKQKTKEILFLRLLTGFFIY